MTIYWRAEPFSVLENQLLEAVAEAHYKSSFRDNLSSDAVLRAAVGSGNYFQSIAAALMTLGGVHGPVEEAMTILSQPIEDIKEYASMMIASRRRVAGFGNGFHKSEPDPNWAAVEEMLARSFPEWSAKLKEMTEFFHSQGKKIFPNPAAYTAVTALIFGMPFESVGYLFVQARLGAWSQIFQANIRRL
jgi:citrate synthase